jgi:hypothetical protein
MPSVSIATEMVQSSDSRDTIVSTQATEGRETRQDD